MTIYVVSGQSGEYEDHREWLVIAYASEFKAKEHAASAAAKNKEYRDVAGPLWLEVDDSWKTPSRRNEFDPDEQMHPCEVFDYYVTSVELVES